MVQALVQPQPHQSCSGRAILQPDMSAVQQHQNTDWQGTCWLAGFNSNPAIVELQRQDEYQTCSQATKPMTKARLW